MTPWSVPALLVLGIALGPHALNVLAPSVLSFLDPVTIIAIATVGTLAGLGVEVPSPGVARRLTHTMLATVTTMLIVSGGLVAAQFYWLSPGSADWLLSIALGICGASLNSTDEESGIGNSLVIIAGGCVVACLRQSAAVPLLLLVLGLMGLAIIVAFAGSLLVSQTSSEREQHVFVVGSLLLAGGVASYLSLSVLMAGLFAGLTWTAVDTLARIRVTRAFDSLEHALVALLLLVAGASVTLSVDVAMLAVVYLLGNMAVALIRRRSTAVGVIGIALAIDLLQSSGRSDWTATLAGVLVVGTIAANALALVMPAREAQ